MKVENGVSRGVRVARSNNNVSPALQMSSTAERYLSATAS